MQFNNPTSTKNENKNMTTLHLRNSISRVAFAARFSSHPARARLLCAFADGASGYSATGRRLSRTTTPLRVTMRSSASPPASTTRPSVFTRSLSNTTGNDNTATGAGRSLIALPASIQLTVFRALHQQHLTDSTTQPMAGVALFRTRPAFKHRQRRSSAL